MTPPSTLTFAYFKTLSLKLQLISESDDDTVREQMVLSEGKVAGLLALGLHAAVCIDGLAISLQSSERWNVPIVSIEFALYNEKEDIEIESVDTRHASTVEHLQHHKDWILESQNEQIVDGGLLWEKRTTLYPNLDFCMSVMPQLSSLPQVMLSQVSKRLRELDKLCEKWSTTGGAFGNLDHPSKMSVESQSTMSAFGNLRQFECPDGEVRSFEWHSRATPGAWRIHFFPVNETTRCYVGYIGRKLRSSQDPT